jgi:nitronate monooxygenase
VEQAREGGDADRSVLFIGQDSGLIHDVSPAGQLVARIVAEAETLLKDRPPGVVRAG